MPPAEVVLPALEEDAVHRTVERDGCRGNVLGEQLLLQRLRRGRDDDPLAGGERRHEVREALARPGAGLREQVLARLERLGHGGRQLELLGARLERGQRGRQPALRPEERLHLVTVDDRVAAYTGTAVIIPRIGALCVLIAYGFAAASIARLMYVVASEGYSSWVGVTLFILPAAVLGLASALLVLMRKPLGVRLALPFVIVLFVTAAMTFLQAPPRRGLPRRLRAGRARPRGRRARLRRGSRDDAAGVGGEGDGRRALAGRRGRDRAHHHLRGHGAPWLALGEAVAGGSAPDVCLAGLGAGTPAGHKKVANCAHSWAGRLDGRSGARIGSALPDPVSPRARRIWHFWGYFLPLRPTARLP